jgi:hypothetical protein
MTRLSAVLALALAACSTEPVAEDASALPVDQAAPPAALSWNFPGYLIKGTASSITVTGGPATGTAAFAISTAASGAPACPPVLAPDCLGIPGPVQIVTTRPFSAGSATFSITVPTTVPLTQVWIQIPGIQGANKFLSPAVRAQLLTPTGDFDGDGVTNIEEALTFGTSPLLADTDGDGLDDGDEIGIGSNPLSDDSDSDGLTDGDEAFVYGTNPTDEDSDVDGLTDGEEVLVTGTSPLSADTDNDDLNDFEELFSYGTDPVSADSDSDGLTDGEEVIVTGTNPLSADTDGDDLNDFVELFSYFTNPLIADTDADGLTDGEEVIVTGTNPLDADSDDDALTDGQEAITYGTNPLAPDTDGGGESDGAEVAAGRDPLSASDDFGGGGIGARLLITEVVDHLSFTGARFVEIYNSGDAPQDLTGWRVQRYSNGTTTASNLAITAGSVINPGQFYVMAASNSATTGFPFVFGFDASQYNSGINANGDDAYALDNGTQLVDVWGLIGQQPAAGTGWNFTDSVVTRNPGIVAPNPVFDLAEWTITAGDSTAAPFVR